MTDQKRDLLSPDTIDLGTRTGANRPAADEPHEPPRITRLGTVAELTLGHPIANETDGSFPGSIFT
jgi:hypothetical protein